MILFRFVQTHKAARSYIYGFHEKRFPGISGSSDAYVNATTDTIKEHV